MSHKRDIPYRIHQENKKVRKRLKNRFYNYTPEEFSILYYNYHMVHKIGRFYSAIDGGYKWFQLLNSYSHYASKLSRPIYRQGQKKRWGRKNVYKYYRPKYAREFKRMLRDECI